MATIQRSMYCRQCGRNTLHAKEQISSTAGCGLTLLTAGVFLPIWGLLWFIGNLKGLHCQQCGRKKGNW